jgi:hypothetical protein
METLLYLQKVNMAFSRGAITSQLREIDPKNPITWEFSAFSQNGEDGIIDYLTQKIINPNYYFIEVGASNGLENNTSWLALGRKYEGIMIEGSEESVLRIKQHLLPLMLGVEAVSMFVDLDNTEEIISRSLYKDTDVFSLDIDGNDYYIVKRLLESGLKPKIFVVEYNSAFGPKQSISIKYDKNFQIDFESYENYLYFGVSVAAWKKLFELHGYKFITVERRGANAFFVAPEYFEEDFVANLKGLDFAEKYRVTWEEQFKLISHRSFLEI